MDPDKIEAGPELDSRLHRLLGGRADGGVPSYSTDANAAREAGKRFGGVRVVHEGGTYTADLTTADGYHEAIGSTEPLAISRVLLKALLRGREDQ